MPSKKPLWAAAVLAAVAVVQSSPAQTVTVYSYGNVSSLVYWSETPRIGNTNYGYTGFNMADDQPTRWRNLLSSSYVRGPAAGNPVRGRDVMEDLDINWATPGMEADGNTVRRQKLSVSNTIGLSALMAQTTINYGPHQGESFRTSPNLLAMEEDGALFLDDDGDGNYSISFYNQVAGTLTADHSWTYLSGGGVLGSAETKLSPALFSQYFIGAEETLMAFLVEPSVVEYYYQATGLYFTTVDYSEAIEGPLATHTLADIIDGKVPDLYYLGIDIGPVIMEGIAPMPVPEPSTGLLALCGAGLLARRRRASR